jgi:DNA-binding transcriptional MerR regulator
MTALLSKSQLARRVDVDPRTLTHRIKSLGIEPAAVLGNGRHLYSPSAIEILKGKREPISS